MGPGTFLFKWMPRDLNKTFYLYTSSLMTSFRWRNRLRKNQKRRRRTGFMEMMISRNRCCPLAVMICEKVCTLSYYLPYPVNGRGNESVPFVCLRTLRHIRINWETKKNFRHICEVHWAGSLTTYEYVGCLLCFDGITFSNPCVIYGSMAISRLIKSN